MTYLLFDLAILAVLALGVLRGRKRGFILTLCGLLALFVAFVGASFFSNLLSAPVARLIEPVLEQSITEILQEAADESQWQLELPEMSELLDGEEIPEELQLPVLPVEEALKMLKESELYRGFGGGLERALEDGLLEAASSAAAAIAAYLARELARMALFAITFVVVLLGWNLLSHALDLAFRLPVLSWFNRTMGGVLGFLSGALLVFIAVWLLKDSVIPPEAAQQTYLLKFFWENSPLSIILALL